MGRKRKKRKHRHSSLVPEFDEINHQALREASMPARIDFPLNLRDSKGSNKVTTTHQSGAQDDWGYGSGTGSYYTSHAHKGHDPVWEDPATGKKLYGSNMHSIDEFSDRWDLFIDLASIVRESFSTGFVKKTGSRFGVLNKFTTKQAKKMKMEHLPLDWMDMQPPPATLEFWLTLWEMLPEKTVIACMGGHGRTGTCMVALMIAAGVDYYTALSWVRTKHCEKAVETIGQEKYLHEIYCDSLKRQLEAAITEKSEEKLIKELQGAIQYALENPPSYSNTQAVKSKGSNTSSSTNSYGNGDAGTKSKVSGGYTHFWIGDDHFRKDSNGFVDIQECTDPSCKVMLCRLAKHANWVEFGKMSSDGKKVIPFYETLGGDHSKLPTV